MALRRFFGFSDGELCRSDAKPCSRLMRHTAGLFTVGGDWLFGFFVDYIMAQELPYPELFGGLVVELYQ
ncbi:hypothetical protein Scep_028529 [Stephania cephalantha]|uniref:DUF7875 domain-containing protein n=1 Tax=Stephania cephalantha TaxID=152367 RepID=A0AAP0EEP8_9MAGN